MYSNNKEKYFLNKRKNKQKTIQYSFDEIIYQPELFLQILENSFNNQKNFINYIKTNLENFPNIKSIQLTKQLFNILPLILNILGLPFSSLLLEENDLIQLFLEIYSSYNEFSKQIYSIFENIYVLFEPNEEYLLENPFEDLKDLLLDLDIINENKINININNSDLNEIQIMFINLNNLYDNWIQVRNMGNYIEEEYLEYFDECLKLYVDKMQTLQDDENISVATFEYFEEMILNFKNEKFKNENKYIDNSISLDNQIYNFNNLNLNNINEASKINIKNQNQNKNQNINEVLNNLRKIPLNKRTFFYKNEKIIEDENLSIEYKAYFFPFRDKQIFELKRQICGFLNSDGGRLYIGITDQKIIKGIVLNNNNLKYFQNLLFSFIDNFSPKIEDNKIKVYYIPIKNIQNDKYIENLYIIKIIICPGDPKILYSFSSKIFCSTIRLQGQCANLTAEEIHKNIIDRHKNKNIMIKNKNDFDDPPPEIVNDINNNNNYIEDEDEDFNQFNITQGESFYLSNRRNNRRRKRNRNRNKTKEEKFITIKIYNIDENIFVNDLINLFKDSGSFSCKFFQKKSGKSVGFGFLYFKDDILANNFIQSYNNRKLGNKNLKVKKTKFKKE